MQTSKGLKAQRMKGMKIFVVSICSLALASVVYGAQKEEKKPQQKKSAQTTQYAAQPTHAAGAGASGKKPAMATHQRQNGQNAQSSKAAYEAQKRKKSQTSTRAYEGQKPKQRSAST